MFGPLQHLLATESHVGIPARVNWFPWQSDDRQYLGWRIEPHDDGETTFLYLVPDLEAESVRAAIHSGPHGDPTKDGIIAWIGE